MRGGSGFNAGERFTFTLWDTHEKTYFTGLTSGLRYYDGSVSAAVTPSGSNEIDLTKLGPYITMHKSRLWATHVDELTYSVYASEVGFDDTWLGDSHLQVADPLGGRITGLASFFDFLLIFKTTGIFRFIGDVSTTIGAQQGQVTTLGCIAPRTIAPTKYGVLYLGARGLYLTDGLNPSPDEISLPVQTLFLDRNDSPQYPDAVGRWYPQREQYVLKLDPDASDGYVLTRRVILAANPFTGERERTVWLWAHHTNLNMLDAVAFAGSDDDGRMMLAGADGDLRIFDNGDTDEGEAYACTVQTASRALDQAGRTGYAQRIKALHRSSIPLTGALRYDQHSTDDTTFSIGRTASADQRYSRASLFDMANHGRFVSVVLSNASDGPAFEVAAIDLDIRFKGKRVWDDPVDG